MTVSAKCVDRGKMHRLVTSPADLAMSRSSGRRRVATGGIESGRRKRESPGESKRNPSASISAPEEEDDDEDDVRTTREVQRRPERQSRSLKHSFSSVRRRKVSLFWTAFWSQVCRGPYRCLGT